MKTPGTSIRSLWRGSIRTQLIVTNILVLALLLLVLGVTVGITVRKTMMQSVDSELDGRFRQVEARLHRFISMTPPDQRAPGKWPDPRMPGFGQHRGGPPGERDGRHDDGGGRMQANDRNDRNERHDAHGTPPAQQKPSPADQAKRQRDGNPFHISVFYLDGKQGLFGGDAPQVWDAAALQRVHTGLIVRSTTLADGERIRVLTRSIPDDGPAVGYVQAPYPLTDVERAAAGLDRALLLLSPLALLFAGVGGALLTDRMLRRVRTMSQAAGRIGADDLAARLPVTGADEFSQLATTFNGLLGRVETAFRAQERLIEMQRRFTADASHELKTPLTTIKGTASMALASPLSPELFRQSLVEIDRAAGTMSHLVQDLLLLAHADDGRAGEDRIEMLVREVLELAMPPRTPGIPAAPVTLKIADESLTVVGNETELVRLFRNLLDNAVRYTPPTGTVTVTAHREGQQAIISVADTGPGIAPEHLPHLGERFYRVDASRARPDGGTGLGISISQSIAEGHGGKVTFESAVGVGTTARVTLPAG